ncbi:hypothetical protein QR680_010407 [Steinernema hermaphroditum]|uniref:UBC core domain-containing protein n=1 Tax=Steinernema hermaphroditum TaxID=289476 RepID=A0AA39IQP3_9BILA|nr:hypothetical protein QR680_010407 [Steinernema hermaphroditum]
MRTHVRRGSNRRVVKRVTQSVLVAFVTEEDFRKISVFNKMLAVRPGTSSTSVSAMRALAMELKGLQQSPMEGFVVKANEEDLFSWDVAIFGPPGTIYEGGYFKAVVRFPSNYPYAPPSVRFLSKLWHPNVYENGDLCISILHPPVNDPHSGELPCERWNPTQNVRTILLSVISLLNEPNTSSPANVDASVSYRKWKESNGGDDEYARIVRKQVELTKQQAEEDGVSVPTTIEQYCIKEKKEEPMDALDFDEYYYDYDDYLSDSADDCDDSEGEDSGQGDV